MKYNYLPPLSNIRSSLKYRSKEYIQENSLHGVPYFADPTRPIWERGIWFVLTMASIGTTILTIITIWDKFQEKPTLTGLDTNIMDLKITFPQIFLCFDGNQLNYSGIAESEKKFYQTIYDWKWSEEINIAIEKNTSKRVKSYRETFTQWAPDCNVIIRKYIPRNGTDLWDNDFESVVTSAGICCKYNLRKPVVITDVPTWQVRFSSSVYPLRLYLLEHSDLGPTRDAYPLMNLEMPANIQLEVYYTYSTSDLEMLSRYQRQCYYKNEQSSYNNCRLNCVSNNILEKCNCLPWFAATEGVKECTLSEYSCVSKAHRKDIDCGCVLPCNFTAFQLVAIEQEKELVLYMGDEATRIFFLWPKRLFRREIRFGYLDLVVSFGGIAGLFLGYSILTSVELFYYFSFRIYCGAVLDSSRKKKNIIKIREKKIKTPPKSDIKFIHYDYFE